MKSIAENVTNGNGAQTGTAVFVAAQRLLASGLSVIPIDWKTKRAVGSWTIFQNRQATADEMASWRNSESFAIVAGNVSGGLEILDFDANGDADPPRTANEFFDHWLLRVGHLVKEYRLPIQITPGKGFQIVYCCPEPGGNQKLAWIPDATQKHGRSIAIETRGEGGYFLFTPSLHPTGGRYSMMSGDLAETPLIPQSVRDELIQAAKELDEMPHTRQELNAVVTKQKNERATQQSHHTGDGVIDTYNQRHKIADVLRKYGYTGDGARLKRPSGDSGSVHIDTADNVAYPWSSNDPLQKTTATGTPKPVDPFAAYTLFEHNGDVKAAVKAAAGLLGMEYKNGAGPIPTEPGPIVGNDDVAAMLGRASTEPEPDWDNGAGPTIRVANEPTTTATTRPLTVADWTAVNSQFADDTMPELPASAQLADCSSCAWLDAYTKFSQLWSPRGWMDFHAAAGLWLLSTVAARRVEIHFGGPRYTNLYLAFCADTTIYGKTTTSKIATAAIDAAGLGYLLAPDDSTPQAFVQTLAENSVTFNLDAPPAAIDAAEKRLMFSGQRGWAFEEFGGKVAAMMRPGSSMAEYRSLFLRFDDSPKAYEYRTIGRGTDTIHNPYLALLANVTPAYLQPFAGRGAPLWHDGFWARFALITPPEDAPRLRGRFPDGERIFPNDIIAPLLDWHRRLGEPHIGRMDVHKTGKDGLPGPAEGTRLFRDGSHPVNPCSFGPGVVDAYYRYTDALLDLAMTGNKDLIGNYGRFAEKALRVAMLFASLENRGLIEMPQWAQAQNITERWRENLHNLYTQLTSQVDTTKTRGYQDAIIRQIAKCGPGLGLTKRDITRKVFGLDAKTAGEVLEALVDARVLGLHKVGRREEFVILSADV